MVVVPTFLSITIIRHASTPIKLSYSRLEVDWIGGFGLLINRGDSVLQYIVSGHTLENICALIFASRHCDIVGAQPFNLEPQLRVNCWREENYIAMQCSLSPFHLQIGVRIRPTSHSTRPNISH